MNKKFQFNKEEMDESFVETLKFLEKILYDCREYLAGNFKKITDINLENLRDFLIPILKAFSGEKISVNKMGEFGDALEIYIHRRYMSEFPETSYPDFSDENPLSIPLTVLSCIEGGVTDFIIFPEDADFFIEMLKETPEKAAETNKKIYTYVKQFNKMERFNKGKERGLFDKW